MRAIDADLGDALQKIGAPTEHIEVTDASGRNPLPNPTGDPRRFPEQYGHAMRNVRWSTLRAALAERFVALGGEIECDRALAAVDGTTLSLTDGAGARHTAGGYDVVVGADGLRSNLRAQLVDDGDPRDAGRTIWRAVIPFTPALRRVLSENACSMSAGSGKVGFLTDIGDDLLYSASSDGRVFSRERRPKM